MRPAGRTARRRFFRSPGARPPRHGLAVGAVLGHRVEGIDHRQYPRQQRNLLALEAPRVALAVPALVVGQDVLEMWMSSGDACAILKPTSGCRLISCHSASFSGARLARMFLSTLILPMSCSVESSSSAPDPPRQLQRAPQPLRELRQPLRVGLGFVALSSMVFLMELKMELCRLRCSRILRRYMASSAALYTRRPARPARAWWPSPARG